MIWLYAGFIAFVLLMLTLDLGVFHRHAHVVSFRESLTWSVVWVALALVFNYAFYRYASHQFGEADVDFAIAFAGIAAVAIENGQFSDRIRQQALVRSNFERFFTPHEIEARLMAAVLVASVVVTPTGGRRARRVVDPRRTSGTGAHGPARSSSGR